MIIIIIRFVLNVVEIDDNIWTRKQFPHNACFQMATYNWISTCRCGNPVEYHCSTCGDKLCTDCKETHLQSNSTKHHSVMDYSKKLMPDEALSLLCPDHGSKECVYWCQRCDTAACMDCVISSHHGHSFTKLENILQEKRANLQRELKNLESNPLQEWQNLLEEARQTTADFLNHVDGVERELEERATKYFTKKWRRFWKTTKRN